MPDLTAFYVTDREAWNAFVERAPQRSFPQLWEWGELREPAGWRAVRFAVGRTEGEPLAGAQVLIRRVPLLGWRLGYAPRGPIGDLDEPATRRSLLAALRHLGRMEGIATLKVDPEATAADPLGAMLLAAPWRRASKVQPPRTRVIDLLLPEDELLANLRQKHRQYVHKAERAGVQVEQVDPAADPATALADFYQIYAHTAERAGFVVRVPAYYERVWRLFAPAGHARLFFATLEGERIATLFHFTCGDRAAEAYGGMTDLGATSRANYLLKWEAIRAFRGDGFAAYDLWGLATGGIAQFKEGFGGRRIDYVGARDLPLRSVQDAALRLLLPGYGIAQRARIRLSGRRLAGSDD
jgi:lipid II:glycine glycyltransferase (peptidoglycan interpeptide bridge formation enzyme)